MADHKEASWAGPTRKTFWQLGTAAVLAAALGSVVGFVAGVLVAPSLNQSERPAATLKAEPGISSTTELGNVSNVNQLMTEWSEWNEKCTDSGPSVEKDCGAREEIGGRLEASGMCYGRQGEAGYQWAWHVCGPSSCKPGVADDPCARGF